MLALRTDDCGIDYNPSRILLALGVVGVSATPTSAALKVSAFFLGLVNLGWRLRPLSLAENDRVVG